MLIKSVIKAGCRRLIIVILHLTVKNIKCHIFLIINTLLADFINNAEIEPICTGPKKISYEQKKNHSDL
jgi:hypothetical protein